MRLLFPLGALAMACASTPPPHPPPPVTPTAELPRSSIAAILLHREDLALTPTQVETLVRRDDALAREDEALRTRLASTTSASTAAPTATPSPSSGGRGGRHGARRAPAQTHAAPDALTQLDDNDTRAYLEVEEQVLTETQRPRAREIASAYREALYDQQHPSTVHGRADAGAP